MNPPIPNCDMCGKAGMYQNVDGAYCHQCWKFSRTMVGNEIYEAAQRLSEALSSPDQKWVV